ncbi:MAG: DNA polymerase III subunit beta [Minisyncoccia bacterium]
MRIILNKKKFADAIHTASRFAERRSSALPILSSILILAGEGGVKLRATNLETGIDLSVEGQRKEDGIVAIPSTIISQLASSLSGEGTLEIEHAGDIARVTAGQARASIKTVPYEDFPALPLPEGKNKFTAPGTLLKELLVAIASCASSSSVRPELASVLFSLEGGTLTLVATDSFRLVEKKLPLGKGISGKFLIPAKNTADIAQALPASEISITFDEHQCAFAFEGGVVVSRLTNATYPDYRQIIPKEVAAEATVLRKDLDAALKHATIFSDSFQKVALVFDPKKKALGILAKNQNVGESADSITAASTGAPLELSFNHRYLSSALALTGAESITLTAAGLGRPLLIRATGDPSFLYLVSPMNQ